LVKNAFYFLDMYRLSIIPDNPALDDRFENRLYNNMGMERSILDLLGSIFYPNWDKLGDVDHDFEQDLPIVIGRS